MASIIASWGGTVEKFVGDAVMAVFGIPAMHEDDAERGLRAALEMQVCLREMNPELAERHGVELTMRVGVNTGEVIAGTGGDQFMVTRDVVNVAARLQQTADPGEVVAEERTYLSARGAYVFEPLEEKTLKGRTLPIRAWRLVEKGELVRPRGLPGVSTQLIGRLPLPRGTPSSPRRSSLTSSMKGVLARAPDAIVEVNPDALVTIPDTVRGVLAARVDALPPTEKRALQDAAVIGRIFWATTLESMHPDGRAREALRGLEDKALIVTRSTSGLPGQTEFSFRHGLARDVAYQSIPKGRRARAHADVARWIERLAGDRREVRRPYRPPLRVSGDPRGC